MKYLVIIFIVYAHPKYKKLFCLNSMSTIVKINFNVIVLTIMFRFDLYPFINTEFKGSMTVLKAYHKLLSSNHALSMGLHIMEIILHSANKPASILALGISPSSARERFSGAPEG